MNDIIVRKVTWDRDIDLSFTKEMDKKQVQNLADWPSIEIQHTFIPSFYAANIIKMIDNLDSVIQNGILLKQNVYPNWEWRDLELKRLYDWGQIHNTWSTNMKNEEVENKIAKLIDTLEVVVESEYQEIQAVYLNYSTLPDEYKRKVSLGS